MKLFDKSLDINSLIRKNKAVIILLLIGTALRFYGFNDWSLSNDELGTIYRASYNSIGDVISQGIMTDNHPVLLEFFIYVWLNLFGKAAFIFRFPFVILGCLSMIYFYRLLNDFFNRNAALIGLSFFVVSQFFILYSQIGRNYVLGLFLMLAFAYHFLKLLLSERQTTHLVASILYGILCLISNYVCAFGLGIFMILCLGFISKNNYKSYLISSFSIAILYIPHIEITLEHLSHKSIAWLPVPEEDFLFTFLEYTFNNSSFLLFTLIVLFIVGLIYKFKLKWLQVVFLFSFLVPYFTTYYYSIKVGPILQYSILIFSMPFLLMFLVSTLPNTISKKVLFPILMIIVTTGLYALNYDLQFYSKKRFADFKGVTQSILKWRKKYDNTFLHLSNSNNPLYLQYYVPEKEDSITFDIKQFAQPDFNAKARDLIYSSNKPFLLISFANVPVPLDVYEFTKDSFPEKVEHFKAFNSEAILLKKSKATRSRHLHSLIYYDTLWNTNGLTMDRNSNTPNAFYSANGNEYAATYENELKDVFCHEKDFLTISLKLKHDEIIDDLKLVVSVENDDGSVYWRATDCVNYYLENKWYTVKHVLGYQPTFKDTDRIKIYLWNASKKAFYISDFELSIFDDSDYHFYDF